MRSNPVLPRVSFGAHRPRVVSIQIVCQRDWLGVHPSRSSLELTRRHQATHIGALGHPKIARQMQRGQQLHMQAAKIAALVQSTSLQASHHILSPTIVETTALVMKASLAVYVHDRLIGMFHTVVMDVLQRYIFKASVVVLQKGNVVTRNSPVGSNCVVVHLGMDRKLSQLLRDNAACIPSLSVTIWWDVDIVKDCNLLRRVVVVVVKGERFVEPWFRKNKPLS